MTHHKVALRVLLLATLLIVGRPLMAAESVNMRMPIDMTSFDPCSNENVDLTGSAHLSGSLTMNGNTFHLSAHVNYHVEGTGELSGASYSSNATGYEGENVELDNMLIGEATIVLHTVLIGQGDVPNANADAVAHITVDANGNMTAVIDDVRLTCN
jgi:hypothetical protein